MLNLKKIKIQKNSRFVTPSHVTILEQGSTIFDFKSFKRRENRGIYRDLRAAERLLQKKSIYDIEYKSFTKCRYTYIPF